MAEIMSSLLGPHAWSFHNRTLLFHCHHPHLVPLNPCPVSTPTSSSALRPLKRYTAALLTTCCTSSYSSDANSVSSDMVVVSATAIYFDLGRWTRLRKGAMTDPVLNGAPEYVADVLVDENKTEISELIFYAANIGDSGFVIIREGAIFDKSNPMAHQFNLPLLTQSGDIVLEVMEVYRIDLKEGDVIVTATDGLLDNLYEQEIASIVPKKSRRLLASKAQEVGRLASTRSPFADAAKAAGYVEYIGGKLDDETVLVSVVQKTSSSNL